MNFFDLFVFVIENIRRQKSRVILTSLGVMIGSASIILLVALVAGLQQMATAQFSSNMDLSQITVSAGYSGFGGGGAGGMGGGLAGMPGEGSGGGGNVRTSSESETIALTDDMIEQILAIENVSSVIAEQSISGMSILKYKKFQGMASITGVALDDLADMGLTAAEGDLELCSGCIILGARVSENFYRPNYSGSDATLTEDLFGKQIKLTLTKMGTNGPVTKTITLRVSAILEETGDMTDNGAFVGLKDADAIYQWQNGEKINHNVDGYSTLIVNVNDSDNVMTVAEEITNLGLQATTAQSFLENINSIFTLLQLVFGGVGAITLFVAAIGIANTMTMAIMERTKEIGLLKALGATNQDILSLFVGEAAGIGFLGGLGGVLLGVILGNMINAIAGPYLEEQASTTVSMVYMPFYLPLFALVFSAVMGSLSGLYPALKAASMLPVVALKHE